LAKGKDILQMKGKELKRCWIIQKAIEERITQSKAAALLGLCERQVRRLIRRFRGEKEKGLIHRLRGRPSNRKYPGVFKKKVLRLYEKHYEGFGPTLAHEKLLKRDKVRINRETLRQWLIEGKLWERRRQRKVHREWRERKASFGEMVQMDGSHHDWLEGRGPKLVLMAYVDDATGNVFARFYDYEGTQPALESFYLYARRYGLPQAIYLDCHTTYKSNGKWTLENELEGKGPKSQFGRALEELGVQMIHAYSPQAKGRVERQFGTFQDRLVKEMRLLKIKSKEEANEFLQGYLPSYNQRFAKEPRSPVNLHRRPKAIQLLRALSIRKEHTLRNDNTIRHEGKLYQIKDRFPGRRPRKIVAEERFDGKLCLTEGERLLCYQAIPEPRKESPKSEPETKPRRPSWHPQKSDHPWKGGAFRPDPLRVAPSDYRSLIQKKDDEAEEILSSYQPRIQPQESELIST